MYIVFTARDGPLASTYTRAVADRAVWNLKVLYPGDRVWVMEGAANEVRTRGLEVLASLEDAEIATAYRVTYQEGSRVDTHLRQTLRGADRNAVCGERTGVSGRGGLAGTRARARAIRQGSADGAPPCRAAQRHRRVSAKSPGRSGNAAGCI